MKKVLSLVVALVMLCTMACVAEVEQYSADATIYDEFKAMIEGKDVSEIKIGYIFIGDEAEGYTAAHMTGMYTMCEQLGIDFDTQVICKFNILENEQCYEAAVELAEDGCDIIFANSFGHEGYIMQAAAEYPEIQFCHATGYQAASSGLANMHNFFVNVYESRYVSGVVAGTKINQMVADGLLNPEEPVKVGYVGAFSYAEVVSGYSAFYLGLLSAADDSLDVDLSVTFTGSWASQALEYDAATSLITQEGVHMISQHADTTGAASACEENGLNDVGYNVSMLDAAPNYALTSASLNWGVYYTYAVASMIAGTEIVTDWTAGYEAGAVLITEINPLAFASTEDYEEAVTAANNAIAGIMDGSIRVFDTSTFTVGGETLTTTVVEEGDTEYILTDEATGITYFAESTFGSAPAFAYVIDGVTWLNSVY